jgi:hypothetical protein
MKILRFLILPVILIFFNSCSKDEPDISKGFVKTGNNKFDLNYGYFEKIQLVQGSQLRIHLSDKKITFNNGDMEIVEPRDNYIVFILHNPNSNFQNISDYYPLSTDYENINISDNIPFLVLSDVSFKIFSSDDKNLGSAYRNFIWDDGSITFGENDTDFQINFSLKKDDKLVKGEYFGTLRDISTN